MKLRGACFTVVMLAACKPAPVARPAGRMAEPAPVAAAPPCRDIAPVPQRLAGEVVAIAGTTPPPHLKPELMLEDMPRVGVAVPATIDPGPGRYAFDQVVLRGDRLTLDVDRFNRAETSQKPRERLVSVHPLAFEITGAAAGATVLEAGMWSDGRMWAVRWPLTVAAPEADRCPPPEPSAITLTLAGDDEDGPPRARLWYTRPPQVGVASMLHLELRPAESLDHHNEAPWSLSYETKVQPAPDEALGIVQLPPDGRKKLRPRWVGDSRIAFDVPITPTRSGELPLNVTVQLYLCSTTSCHVARPYQLTATVPVAAQNGPAMPR